MQVREPWSRDHARLMFAAAACSDAQVRADGQTGVGDRTELAILTAAAERGIHRDEIEHTNARIAEIPFDSVLKRMSIQCADSH